MSTAELRAMAQLVAGKPSVSNRYDDAANKLARHILATTADDDGEHAALLAGYVYEDDHQRIRVGISGVDRYGVFLTRLGMAGEHSNCNELWLADVRTMRDVRALLAALGVGR